MPAFDQNRKVREVPILELAKALSEQAMEAEKVLIEAATAEANKKTLEDSIKGLEELREKRDAEVRVVIAKLAEKTAELAVLEERIAKLKSALAGV